MTEEKREKWNAYNRGKQRDYYALRIKNERIQKGKCPVCTIFLDPEFEKWHQGCSWYTENIQAKLEITPENEVNLF